MYKRWIRQYSGLLILGLLLIAGYRLFDNIIAVGNMIMGLTDILFPFIIGGVLAYFLGIPAVALEEKLKKQERYPFLKKKARIVSILFVFFVFIIAIIAVLGFVVPMISDNITELIDRSPIYLRQLKTFFKNLRIEYGVPNLYSLMDTKISEYINNFMSVGNLDILELVGQGIGVVSTILSIFMAIVVCPYLIYERSSLLSIFDHLMLTMISERDLRFIHRSALKIHHIFADFIYGKALDSLIIGIIAYVGFWLMGVQYAFLLAVVIGVTNMIPYFGPFFGGVPVTLVVVLTDGFGAGIWTGLFIFALQQFDGLLLGPYILGESVGVSALWIIFAVTFFGGTMGFVGMVIGVPLIATIRLFYHQAIRYHELKEIIRKHKLMG